MKAITRTVWILSLISLFTDTASEMLYPVLPVYFKSIGFSVVLIGVLEGIAEATAGLSKGYFGKISDNSGKRAPFIQFGYLLSAISKPMMAIFTFPLWVFFSRTLDRFGKGVRTGARDALLSDESQPGSKGKIFGFHRSMDTLGAVAGPSIALIYLHFYPENYTTLFFIAFAPGLVASLITLLIKEKKSGQVKPLSASFFTNFTYWKNSSFLYKKIAGGLLLFTLFNSSDMFLLLKIKESGLSDTAVIGTYIFYNLIYALFSFPLGILADKIGLKKVFILGLLFFAAAYLGMAVNTNLYFYFGLFFLYGLFAAATEGVSKAWISTVTPSHETATAIGTYTGFQSIFTMMASSLAGLIWFYFGASTVFYMSAAAALVVIIYFIKTKTPTEPS
jgi:MFS family permease